MKAARVVVVVWAGGVRASETILDPQHRDIPRIRNDLAPRGTLLTRLYNNGGTNYGPALHALATGRCEAPSYASPHPAACTRPADSPRHPGRSTLVIGPPAKGQRL